MARDDPGAGHGVAARRVEHGLQLPGGRRRAGGAEQGGEPLGERAPIEVSMHAAQLRPASCYCEGDQSAGGSLRSRFTVGALLVSALAVLRTGVSRHARMGTLLGMASVAGWAMTESPGMRSAFGNALPLDLLAMVAGGSFLVFVAAVFEDRPLRGWILAPFAVLLATGFPDLAPKPVSEIIWMTHNLLAAPCAYMPASSSCAVGAAT